MEIVVVLWASLELHYGQEYTKGAIYKNTHFLSLVLGMDVQELVCTVLS